MKNRKMIGEIIYPYIILDQMIIIILFSAGCRSMFQCNEVRRAVSLYRNSRAVFVPPLWPPTRQTRRLLQRFVYFGKLKINRYMKKSILKRSRGTWLKNLLISHLKFFDNLNFRYCSCRYSNTLKLVYDNIL